MFDFCGQLSNACGDFRLADKHALHLVAQMLRRWCEAGHRLDMFGVALVLFSVAAVLALEIDLVLFDVRFKDVIRTHP